MTKNTTKRALVSSILVLVLCFTMLLGTTFAWFTDSASSVGNKITTGNLDVELKLWTSATESVEITNTSAPLFGADEIWEPGKTEVVYLSLKNAGSLDLKYKVGLKVYGIEKNLDDVMQYSITPDAKFGEVTAWGNGIDVVPGMNATAANNVALKAGGEHFFALSVHMLEEAGNEYMNGQILFDINVVAGQLASELDSFGSTYDEFATYGDSYVINNTTVEANGTAGEVVTVTNDNGTFAATATVGTTGKVTATIENVNSTAAAFTAATTENKSLLSYDINVTGQVDGEVVTVEIFVGKNLADVVVYHNSVAMNTADYSYSATTGFVTIKTATFSPFEVAFHYVNDAPLAKVTKLDVKTVSATYGMGGAADTYNVDVAYIFEMMETAEQAAANKYAKYHADFVVTVNKDVAPEAIALLGYYEAYCDDYNDGNWVAMLADETIKAGTEIRLVDLLLNGGSINYEELGEFIPSFKCGASMLKDSAAGTTMTVELRLYEVEYDEELNSWNTETGEYLSVCTYTYTFN